MAPRDELYTPLNGEPTVSGQSYETAVVVTTNTSAEHGRKPSSSRLFWYLSVVQAANIHAFLIGYTASFTSPTMNAIVEDLNVCGEKWNADDDDSGLCTDASWLASIINLSALCGALIAGKLADAVGRKRALLFVSVPWVVGYATMGTAYYVGGESHVGFHMVLSGRCICGLAMGMASTLLPLYVSEISDKQSRGTLLSFCNLNISNGIFAISVLGIGVSKVAGFWAIMCFIASALGLAVAFIIVVYPETPTYLARSGSLEEANRALEWLHGECWDEAMRQREIRTLSEPPPVDGGDTNANKALQCSVNGGGGCCAKHHRKPATLGIFVVAAFALSGQKAILAFLNSIFVDAGADPTVGSCGYGFAQILISLLGIRYLVPRFGRVRLLTVSLVGNSVSMALLGFSFFASNQLGIDSFKSWLPIVALVSFISFTAVGLGPLAWAYSSEICPKAIRSLVSGGALFSFWLLSFLETQFWGSAVDTFTEAGVFWGFACFCAINGLIVHLCGVETKGKSLAQIEVLFTGEKSEDDEEEDEEDRGRKDRPSFSV